MGNWCWKCAKSVQNLFYLAELKNWFWANLMRNIAPALSTYLLLSRKALQRLSNILAWYFQQQDVGVPDGVELSYDEMNLKIPHLIVFLRNMFA